MPKSTNIAVAGGTGGIGRYIVEGLLTLKASRIPHLHIIVLSRSKGDNIAFRDSSAQRVQVDYDDKEALTSILRQHRIDTIISTLVNHDLSQFSAIQEKLLRAALDVPTFRRFAPSEFGVDSEATKTYNYYECKLPILAALRSMKATRPSLEWTKFVPGVFTNYFAFGNPKPAGDKALEHLRKTAIRIDISTGTADIPGDGNAKQFYTAAEDVGTLVAEATQLDAWPEQLDMAGDEISFNDIIGIAERVTDIRAIGKKFEVKYNSKEDVLAVMNQPPQEWKDYFYMAHLCVILGETGQGRALNELVPHFKPTTVEQFIETWWGGEHK
ncbi:hypothetical protein V5O48_001435 [Marasmius crinis-equi]|uniref:NmrA-like domain-containing protein n=1 Tax=Marasmius crinis-equi TaxID=585013 RepID=A0ABR3FZ34_9AGAR